jgi:hypothetical protein
MFNPTRFDLRLVSFSKVMWKTVVVTVMNIWHSQCCTHPVIDLSVCPSVHPSIHHLSIYLSVCLSVCLSINLSIYLSVCLSVCLSVRPSIYIYIHTHTYIHVHAEVGTLCRDICGACEYWTHHVWLKATFLNRESVIKACTVYRFVLRHDCWAVALRATVCCEL